MSNKAEPQAFPIRGSRDPTGPDDPTGGPVDVTVERLPPAPRVRRAADVLRLIVAVAVFLAAQLLAILGHTGVSTTEGSVLQAIATLPPSLRDALTVAGQVVVVLLPAGIVVAVLAGRRFALAGRVRPRGGRHCAVRAGGCHLFGRPLRR
jgi:hypothetical protein